MKVRRLRLSFVDPTEDQPRLIRAYGRTRAGEVALVMRPTLTQALLVWIPKRGETVVWCPRTDDGPDDRIAATVLRDGPTQLRLEAGPRSGQLVVPAAPIPEALPHGHSVTVVLGADGTTAHLSLGGDSPVWPTDPMEARRAIQLVTRAQRRIPPEGPVTLRGRWSGALLWGDNPPQLELKRRLAAYGTLWVRSHGAAGWSWAFERGERWFSAPGQNGEAGLTTLAAAMEAGVLGAMRLVREACSHRDTHRRAAFDPDYAKKHPLPQARPGRDPLSSLRRVSGRRRGLAPPPKPLTSGPAPDPPADAAEVQRRAAILEELAADLQPAGTGWVQGDDPVQITAWFAEHDHPEVTAAIQSYLEAPEQTVAALVVQLGGLLDSDVGAEAQERLASLERTLRTGPARMEQARSLLRHAEALARSPRCEVEAQQAALAAVARGAEAYEAARAAVLQGEPWDAQRTLQRIAEEVGAAAESARRCVALRPLKARSRPKGRLRKRATPPSSAPKADADADKDAALLEAFRTAIADVSASRAHGEGKGS